jgi:hypothetical protein
MEIGFEMAQIVLEMREGAKAGSNWRRLELLAEHFLKITGLAPMPQREADHSARIGDASSATSWRM